LHKTKYPLKGFEDFDIDPEARFAICPKTGLLIDDTKSYCKSSFTFGPSQKSFTGCGQK